MDNLEWLRELQKDKYGICGSRMATRLKDAADELERLRERVAEYEHSIRSLHATLNPQEIAIDKGWEAEDVLNDVLDGFAGRTEKDT
jgi:hypothetical protein